MTHLSHSPAAPSTARFGNGLPGKQIEVILAFSAYPEIANS
jgi:hypothetical protein